MTRGPAFGRVHAMSELELQFLGSGNAFAPGGLCWNGFLVNGRFLFEAPPQALMSLNKMECNFNAIEAVVLSHHHGDHFLGIPFLLLGWQYSGRKAPLTIVGPPGTEEVVRKLCALAYAGEASYPFELRWEELLPGATTGVGGLSLEAVAVKHDPKLQHSLGFHARLGDRRFAYTGDSAMCDAVLGLARNAEVLVTECSSRRAHLPTHMNLVDDMPKLRAALPDTSTLLLTHIDAGIGTGGMKNTILAKDFERYAF
jgi:ribonuclease BN (tRNA processing enzyme)